MNLAALWHCPCCSSAKTISTPWALRLALTESETDIQRKAACYQYRHPKRRRHGRRRGRSRRAPRRARRAREPASPISSNAAPTGCARIPCSTPSFTATRPRSRPGARREPDPALQRVAAGQPHGPRGRVARIESEVAAEIEQAVAFAEAGTWEPVEDLTRFVYAETPT